MLPRRLVSISIMLIVSVFSIIAQDANPDELTSSQQDVPPQIEELPGRWSVEKAQAWYAEQPWLVGCNYNPALIVMYARGKCIIILV